MANGNKVYLCGRLGKDADIKEISDGKSVTRLQVATSERWKDKATGENKEDTQWHTVVCFGYLSEYASNLKKGNKVVVWGKIIYDEYKDKDGVDRIFAKVIADTIESFVIVKKDDDNGYAAANGKSIINAKSQFSEYDDIPF